jgi:hypothetical protein
MQTHDNDRENGCNTERSFDGRFTSGNQVARRSHDYPLRQDAGLARSRRELFHRRTSPDDLEQIVDASIGFAKCGSLGHALFVLDSLYGRQSYSENDLREFVTRLATIALEEVSDPEEVQRIRNRFRGVALPGAREA